MSGLFDTLSDRFMPGARPEIRPRAAARFEGEFGGALSEEFEERAVSALPQTSHAAPRSNPPAPLPQSQTRTEPPALPTHEPNAVDHRDSPSEAAAPAADAEPQTERSERPPAQTPRVAAPPPQPETPRTDAPPETPSERIRMETRRKIVRERVVDRPTQDRAEAPVSEPPVPQPEQPATEARAEPAEDRVPEPPTVRIGRIEVRQPAKPAPAPSPAPPRREPPPARSAPSAMRGDTSGSRLTDYLGWKR
jgi:hypothetical protein